MSNTTNEVLEPLTAHDRLALLALRFRRVEFCKDGFYQGIMTTWTKIAAELGVPRASVPELLSDAEILVRRCRRLADLQHLGIRHEDKIDLLLPFLSGRVANAIIGPVTDFGLKQTTIRDLCDLTAHDLLRCRNVGRKGLHELTELLACLGFHLRPTVADQIARHLAKAKNPLVSIGWALIGRLAPLFNFVHEPNGGEIRTCVTDDAFAFWMTDRKGRCWRLTIQHDTFGDTGTTTLRALHEPEPRGDAR